MTDPPHREQNGIPKIFVNEEEKPLETSSPNNSELHNGFSGDKYTDTHVGSTCITRRNLHIDDKTETDIHTGSATSCDNSWSRVTLSPSMLLGSTTSLESFCTARSLGLLSDESDYRFQFSRPSLPGSPTRRMCKRLNSCPNTAVSMDLTRCRAVHSWNDLHSLAAGLHINTDDVPLSEKANNGVISEDVTLANKRRPNSSCDMSELVRNRLAVDDVVCARREKLVRSRRNDKEATEVRVRQWLQELHHPDNNTILDANVADEI